MTETIKMTSELRTMLHELRRDRERQGKPTGGEAELVLALIKDAHKDLLKRQGYSPDATARARINRSGDAFAGQAGVTAEEKIAAAFGRTPEWVRAHQSRGG